MGKNVVIYSDGTGQAGGFRFDENRSNIYKLYRATRCGPDSSVDPREQVAFYDPGLGSQADGGHLFGRLARWIYNLVSQATGFGITANIIDCYAALIRLWRPGDRIFLVGFSRGAYTVRCLAGVIATCGIPTRTSETQLLRLDPSSTHKLASYAVKHVYQFTSSRSPEDANWYQRFLLDTRDRIARRFRADCNSADGENANVYPYFIGVFDTVAALGSFLKFLLFAGIFLLAAAFTSGIISYLSLFPDAPIVGPILRYLTFLTVFCGIGSLALAITVIVFVYTHIKFDFRVPEYVWWEKLLTFHFTDMWQWFYDIRLNENVGYAKHAISIDENRKDFARVGWGYKGDDHKHADSNRDSQGNIWFEQVWFSGNHSDIGGSYPENESRLSDTALDWMLKCATVIPNGLAYDSSVIQPFPSPDGMQHDEVKSGLGLLTKFTGLSYVKKERVLPGPGAVMHRSVYSRFDLPEIQLYDHFGSYRPNTLRTHADFARFYDEGAPFPATSAQSATADAEEPGSHKKVVQA